MLALNPVFLPPGASERAQTQAPSRRCGGARAAPIIALLQNLRHHHHISATHGHACCGQGRALPISHGSAIEAVNVKLDHLPHIRLPQVQWGLLNLHEAMMCRLSAEYVMLLAGTLQAPGNWAPASGLTGRGTGCRSCGRVSKQGPSSQEATFELACPTGQLCPHASQRACPATESS